MWAFGMVVIMKMKAVSKTPSPAFAFFTHTGFCPASVPHVFVSCVPDFHKVKVFGVNVSLDKAFCTNA